MWEIISSALLFNFYSKLTANIKIKSISSFTNSCCSNSDGIALSYSSKIGTSLCVNSICKTNSNLFGTFTPDKPYRNWVGSCSGVWSFKIEVILINIFRRIHNSIFTIININFSRHFKLSNFLKFFAGVNDMKTTFDI